MTSVPVRSPQISSCSMAAARKVSAAASNTVFPCERRRFASLPIDVVLPTPFTPTTRMTSGSPSTFCTGRLSAALRIANNSSFNTRFSSSTFSTCLRSIFSRSASSTVAVVAVPKSAEISVASRSSRVSRSISLRSATTSSMRSLRLSRVRVTASFMRFRKLGFSSVLPNRV